jgi:hypothetical protein
MHRIFTFAPFQSIPAFESGEPAVWFFTVAAWTGLSLERCG